MAFDIRQIDLVKLNSMTKYPSILTYHALGDKGMLQETVQIPFEGRIKFFWEDAALKKRRRRTVDSTDLPPVYPGIYPRFCRPNILSFLHL